MDAEHSAINDGAQGEVVEDFATPPPDVRRTELSLAFVVEAVHLVRGVLAVVKERCFHSDTAGCDGRRGRGNRKR